MAHGGRNNVKTLIRYDLEFHCTLDYFTSKLTDVNALSTTLVDSLDFHSGVFFTLLPKTPNLDNLYEFERGGILPQNAPVKYSTGEGSFTIIPSTKEEVGEFISQEIHYDKNLVCVLDDISRTPNDPGLEIFYQKNSLFRFGEELYYTSNIDNVSPEFVLELLLQSFTFWHTLGIVTKFPDMRRDQILSKEILVSICKEAKLAFIGAYDGEGYIFWERVPNALDKN